MNKPMKSVFLIATFWLSTTAVMAWEGNFLFGLSAGYGVRDQGGLDLSMGHPAPGRQVTTFNTSLFTGSGSIFGVVGGYQTSCDRWTLGAELSIDWQNIHAPERLTYFDALDNFWVANATYEFGTVFGLTARGAYAVSRAFMPYFRLGIETSRDTLTYMASSIPNANGVVLAQTNSQYRLLTGIGFETPIPICSIYPNLTFRMEYNYHPSSDGVDERGFANDNVTFFKVASRPRIQSGKASLIWNFL